MKIKYCANCGGYTHINKLCHLCLKNNSDRLELLFRESLPVTLVAKDIKIVGDITRHDLGPIKGIRYVVFTTDPLDPAKFLKWHSFNIDSIAEIDLEHRTITLLEN